MDHKRAFENRHGLPPAAPPVLSYSRRGKLSSGEFRILARLFRGTPVTLHSRRQRPGLIDRRSVSAVMSSQLGHFRRDAAAVHTLSEQKLVQLRAFFFDPELFFPLRRTRASGDFLHVLKDGRRQDAPFCAEPKAEFPCAVESHSAVPSPSGLREVGSVSERDTL